MGVVPFMLLTLAKQYRNIQSLFKTLQFMLLLYETVVWGLGMGQRECFKRDSRIITILLYYLGCLDYEFLSRSVSAKTTSFIPAYDKMHWLESMSEAR